MLAGEEKRAKLTAPAKKKRKKEEGEPKGVRTSYLFFCEDMREEIDTVNADRRFEFEFESREVVGDWELWRGQAHPTLGLTERAKIVGEKWKSLSEEQKQPYNDKAAADKERFQKEMDAWCAPHMPPAPPNRVLMLAMWLLLAHAGNHRRQQRPARRPRQRRKRQRPPRRRRPRRPRRPRSRPPTPLRPRSPTRSRSRKKKRRLRRRRRLPEALRCGWAFRAAARPESLPEAQ